MQGGTLGGAGDYWTNSESGNQNIGITIEDERQSDLILLLCILFKHVPMLFRRSSNSARKASNRFFLELLTGRDMDSTGFAGFLLSCNQFIQKLDLIGTQEIRIGW